MIIPKEIRPENAQEIYISFNNGDAYLCDYRTLRYLCPCAVCVDEISGKRVITLDLVQPDVRVTEVQTVGRYAVKPIWSDQHSTGMYTYEYLHECMEKHGKKQDLASVQ